MNKTPVKFRVVLIQNGVGWRAFYSQVRHINDATLNNFMKTKLIRTNIDVITIIRKQKKTFFMAWYRYISIIISIAWCIEYYIIPLQMTACNRLQMAALDGTSLRNRSITVLYMMTFLDQCDIPNIFVSVHRRFFIWCMEHILFDNSLYNLYKDNAIALAYDIPLSKNYGCHYGKNAIKYYSYTFLLQY